MTLVVPNNDALPSVRPSDSSRGLIISGLFVAFGLVGTLVAWSAVTILPAVSQAEGLVIVEGNRRPVQSREGGLVSAVLVTNGDHVVAGQELISLDTSDVSADVASLQASLRTGLAIKARLEAEQSGSSDIAFPPELTNVSEPAIDTLIEQQRQVFQSRRNALQSAQVVVQEDMSGLTVRIENLQKQVAQVDNQISTLTEELASGRALLKKGLATKSSVLALERELSALTSNREGLNGDIDTAKSGIESDKLKIEQMSRERTQEISAELAQVEASIADVRPKLLAAQERLKRSVLVAPIDGFVLNLAVHGPGATLGSGEVALEIVPALANLVVSAKIVPRDIERLEVGQEAELHFSTPSGRTQPLVRGTLLTIGADRQVDDRTQQAYYEAIVQINESDLDATGIRLVPGMAVATSIVTGHRTVLEYVIEPIVELGSSAMREI